MTRQDRKFAALLLALFAGALAAAFLVHDSHDRACAETCHVCTFAKAARAIDLTVTAWTDFFATAGPLFIPETQEIDLSSPSLPPARAPPAT